MLVRFQSWEGESELWRERRRKRSLFFDCLRKEREHDARELLRELDERLSLQNVREEFVLICDEVSARPMAGWVSEGAPTDMQLGVGRPSSDHEEALQRVRQEFGVDLSTSRVRVGFTRGHLMDVVVQVPLDVEGESEILSQGALCYVQTRLGDVVFDTWVLEVGVDRIRRTRGLMMTMDQGREAETMPLSFTGALVGKGVMAVTAELPLTLLSVDPHGSDWFALEIPESGGVIQGERRFASTRFPEALKACLEGLPHDSARFTQGGEVFVYVSCELSTKDRSLLREQAESFISKRAWSNLVVLAGTGFGKKTDYFDLWMVPDAERMKDFFQGLSEIIGELWVDFYDEQFADESSCFRPRTRESGA